MSVRRSFGCLPFGQQMLYQGAEQAVDTDYEQDAGHRAGYKGEHITFGKATALPKIVLQISTQNERQHHGAGPLYL